MQDNTKEKSLNNLKIWYDGYDLIWFFIYKIIENAFQSINI